MAIDKKSYSKTKYLNIKIHKDGIKFWFDFTIAGKRYSRLWISNINHSKADRIRQAQGKLNELRKEAIKQESIEADLDATVDTYWDILVRDKGVKKDKNGKVLKDKNGKEMKPKWSEPQMKKNKAYYKTYIQQHFGSKKIRDVKSSMFTRFNRSINHLAPRTQKMAYELLIPIFNLAIEDEIITNSPIKKEHVPKRKALEEKKIITHAVRKYRALYKAINKVYADDPESRAIFLLGFHGRRKNEVLSLKWEDIDFENNEYIIKASNSKVNIDMTFKLPADVKSALLEFRNPQGNIFSIEIITQRYKEIRKEPGVPAEFTFHWMRNLAVSALSAMGVPVTDLSSMLGHTDGQTLTKYLSLQRTDSTAVTNEASAKLLSI